MRCGTTEHFLFTNTYVRGLRLTTYSYLVCVSKPSIIMLSFIPMNTHTHSLSISILNGNTIAQYKGRGNSLNNEFARITYYLIFYKLQALQVYLETPSFILSQIYNLRQTWLPSSSAPLHSGHMTHQPFVHLIA